MPSDVKRRRYESPRRREHARATREAIVQAASRLFLERGYVATTIGTIAATAGVSAETVFAAFGTKRQLLTDVLGFAIAGGVDAPPVMEQGWVGELRAAAGPRARIRVLARNGRAILERRAPMDEVVRSAAAADPEIAAIRERARLERLAGQRELLRMALDGTEPRTGLDFDGALDVLYAIGSPEMWTLLVIERGWSPDRFERWYAETLALLLLPDDPGTA